MELFKNVRLRIGDSILRRKAAGLKRKASYKGFSEVKNIGITWDASRTEDFPVLSKFYQKMLENKTEVKVLGYYPGKVLPSQYTAIRFLSIVKREELSMFYHPVSAESTSFIKNRYDVLIDLNFKNILPLQYITSLSNAGLKVGLYDKTNDKVAYDLMMELKNPVSTEEYLNQVLHYLSMINGGDPSKVINN